jgi:hypothetical protein
MSSGSIRDRLQELPAYSTEQAALEAVRYNCIRLALLRSEPPLRIALQSLRNLDMVIEEDLWVCVDRDLNDVPIVAWKSFRTHGRTGLDAPVPCTVKFYHAHAATIARRVLDDACKVLGARLESR